MARFRTVLADPPWDYQNRGRGSEKNHYRTMTPTQIAALPVADVAAKDAVLLLWGTWPQLPVCLSVIEAWGFQYKTLIPWVKMQAVAAPRIGCGFYARSVSEALMIATRGTKLVPAESKRRAAIMFNPRSRHSAKPTVQYDFAEVYGGPYLEMFARPQDGMFPPREGWTFIGDGATGRDIADDLRLLADSGK